MNRAEAAIPFLPVHTLLWHDTRITIVDTPGPRLRGEVERILNMVAA